MVGWCRVIAAPGVHGKAWASRLVELSETKAVIGCLAELAWIGWGVSGKALEKEQAWVFKITRNTLTRDEGSIYNLHWFSSASEPVCWSVWPCVVCSPLSSYTVECLAPSPHLTPPPQISETQQSILGHLGARWNTLMQRSSNKIWPGALPINLIPESSTHQEPLLSVAFLTCC